MDIEDHDALLRYLERSGRIAAGERPEVRRLGGGVSNRTVLVKRAVGEAWVLKQALAKLRVEVDWFSDPRRIQREALGIRWLALLAPAGAVTPLIFEDPDQDLIAMAAVPEPHHNWKSLLLAGKLAESDVVQFGRILGRIHRGGVAMERQLRPLFGDLAHFESLRLEPYYLYTAQAVAEAAPFITAVTRETLCRRWTLVHGDYSPKNVLVRQGRLVVLDHEVIHFGDGAFDLGFALTHLLSKAHHLKRCREGFARAAKRFYEVYHDEADGCQPVDLEPRAVRHALCCLLARVAGRSRLEYLDGEARRRQREAVLKLMVLPPASVSDLADAFLENVETAERD